MMAGVLLLLCLGHCLPAVLGENNDIAYIGRSVTLTCDGGAESVITEVMWKINRKPASSYKNGVWIETPQFKDRTWLGSNNISLVICPVKEGDVGIYSCEVNGKEKQTINLSNVTSATGQKGGNAETPPGGSDHDCRSIRERRVSPGSKTEIKQDPDENPPGSETEIKQDPDENPPGSETEIKQDPDENPPGPSTGVIVVIVLVVLAVVAGGAAVLIKLWRKHQTNENPTDCISFFHACGKEGKNKRGKNLPDPGPSEDALI